MDVVGGSPAKSAKKKKEKKPKGAPKPTIDPKIRNGKVLWLSGKYCGVIKETGAPGSGIWFHCSDVGGGCAEGESITFKPAQGVDGKKRHRGIRWESDEGTHATYS